MGGTRYGRNEIWRRYPGRRVPGKRTTTYPTNSPAIPLANAAAPAVRMLTQAAAQISSFRKKPSRPRSCTVSAGENQYCSVKLSSVNTPGSFITVERKSVPRGISSEIGEDGPYQDCERTFRFAKPGNAAARPPCRRL